MDRLAVVDDGIGYNLVVLMDWKMDYNPVVVPLVLDFDKDDTVRVVGLDSMFMCVLGKCLSIRSLFTITLIHKDGSLLYSNQHFPCK